MRISFKLFQTMAGVHINKMKWSLSNSDYHQFLHTQHQRQIFPKLKYLRIEEVMMTRAQRQIRHSIEEDDQGIN